MTAMWKQGSHEGKGGGRNTSDKALVGALVREVAPRLGGGGRVAWSGDIVGR